MDSFCWDDNFITGFSDVDEEHYHLIQIINQFGSQIAENRNSVAEIERIFKELAEYAQYHFQNEEELMKDVHLDPRHLSNHIEEHQSFLEEVTSLYTDIFPDNIERAGDLLEFLTHWLAYHILGSDQNMAGQLLAIKEGVNPVVAYENGEKHNDKATEILLGSLNGLFKQVSERNKRLAQLNRELEDKVAERTKELSKANQHLEELALTDVLTGLPNRRHAMRQLEELWSESLQSGAPLTCMMIDADHFKEVNDTYGHDAGDDVLRVLARTLKESVRTDDMVCRLGGDEFFIVCPKTNMDNGVHVANGVQKLISQLRVPTGSGVWQGSISVGVAARTSDMDDYNSLMQQADKGVYAAKRDGKNCVRFAA